MSEWISVEDFKPEESGYVWVTANDIITEWAELIRVYVCPEYGNVIFETLDCEDYAPIVTYVLPVDMPEPPSAKV